MRRSYPREHLRPLQRMSLYNEAASAAEALTVLVQAERTTRVLNEQVQESDFVVFYFRQRRDNLVGDEVGATALGWESKLFLIPRHDAGG